MLIKDGRTCKICGANIEVTEYDNGSKIIRQDCLCKDSGCFGNITNYFVSRLEVPKICGDNRCISMSECFKESFRKQTGLDIDVSYKVKTPKWRIQEK